MDTNSTEQSLTPFTNISDNDSDGKHPLVVYHSNIIVFIFLTAGVCGGLPALAWALWIIYRHCKSGGRISAFTVLLLLNVLSELLLGLFMLSVLFPIISSPTARPYDGGGYRSRLNFLAFYLWSAFKMGGLYLHQLVALESVLSLNNAACSARVFSPTCSVVLSVVLWLVLFGIQLSGFSDLLNIVLCLLPLSILAVSCTLACKDSSDPDRGPHRGAKAGSAVLIVSTLTLVAACVSFIAALVFAVVVSDRPGGMKDIMFTFVMNVRVVSDPLLCVLVCKEKLRAQIQQTHPDQRSV